MDKNVTTSAAAGAALAAASALLPSAAGAQAGSFELPANGCPMAHCDRRMSDVARLSPPLGPVVELWHRVEAPGERAGSGNALGCASNGSTAVCSYASDLDAVVAYDYNGARLWSSGAALGLYAVASVPLLASDGSVIAVDHLRIMRFEPDGTVAWSTPFPAPAIPISPVLTDNGVLVVATLFGPILAFDPDDGALLSVLGIRRETGDPGFFHTRNTPAVRGNRVYIVMEHSMAPALGRLVAMDVTRDGTGRVVLTHAWSYEIGGPSGASPLVIGATVYFDGSRVRATAPFDPHVFAVIDFGARPALRFKIQMPSVVIASMAQDPRGGFWVYARQQPQLLRYDARTGEQLQSIDVDALLALPAPYAPRSALTVTGPPDAPIMLLGVHNYSTTVRSGFVIAIDLAHEILEWAFHLGAERAAGQFPILVGPGGPRVVFSSATSGARALGED